MNTFTLKFSRRFTSLQFSGLMLIALLQRLPVLRVLAAADSLWLRASLGHVLRSTALVASALGLVDTLAGATTFSANPASPASAAVDMPFSAVFAVTGAAVPAGSYTIAGLPPGLTVPGSTASAGGGRLLNSSSGTISGTPTTAGTFIVTITAFQLANAQGDSISNTYTINVAGAVATAPSISSHPASQSVTAGQAASFSVTAGGTAPLSYQWRKNGNNIGGATSSTYSIGTTVAGDAGTYSVVVTNSAGNATSNNATLTVNAVAVAPSISAHPGNQTVTAGQSASFSVTASGTAPLTYQWRKAGNNIGGATSSTYSIGSTVMGDASTYSVVVTNSAGSATSNNATLTVTAAAVAPSISSHPANQSVTAGQAASFSVTAGGTAPLSYQWRKNGNNIGGATSSTYSIGTTVAGDAGTYTVVVTNTAGSATSNGATLAVAPAVIAPSITTQPAGQMIAAGGSVTFTAAASGSPAPTYQWKKNGMNITGATGTSLNLPQVHLSDSGTYTVVVTNAGGSATSSDADLFVFVVHSDFNGDGMAEPLWRNTNTGETRSWFSTGGSYGLGVEGDGWAVIDTGDYDGNGMAEPLWRNSITGEIRTWFLVGGSSGFGTEGDGWSVIDTGDYDGDGLAEPLWRNSITGEIRTWLGAGGSVAFGVEGGGWSVIEHGTGDFDGDSGSEPLWRNSNNGEIRTWFLAGGSVAFGVEGGGWSVIDNGTGDFDGDGRSEPLWRNAGTGDIHVWFLAGGSITFGNEGGGWAAIDAGDYDGNSTAEPLWRNSNTGEIRTWYLVGGSYGFGIEGGGWSAID